MKPLPQSTLKPQNKVIEPKRSHSGIFLGDKCYWNPATLPNGHVAIIGTSGSGKTQTLKAIAYELPKLFPTIKNIIIDYHGDQQLPNEVCYPLARISHKEKKKRGQKLRKCICKKHFSNYKI
jgi:ABC-type uncharacterized transport system fused permease/ATPase subunit